MQEKLKRFQQTALHRWVCHLQQKCSITLTKGGIDKAKALLELIKKGTEKQILEENENATCINSGQGVLSVKATIVDEGGNTATKECITQHNIFDAAKPVLGDRLSGVFSLQFYSGRLFNNLGFIGDSECAHQVFEVTYVFS